uniref:Nuclear protein 1 n=1 Tax=Sphenodon punctatus TaxID=8508 RepID=A0A8D0H1N6_SPHPU
MAAALLQAEKLRPTPFEVEYFDEYDFYSLTERYSMPGGPNRKGRSKRESGSRTNRPSPGGHERKITLKLQRSERKRQGAPATQR